jgi:hypothetical protein
MEEVLMAQARKRAVRRARSRQVGAAAAALVAAVALAGPAAAQHEGHGAESPYAAAGSAEVQTLTAAEVAGLLEGEGMGLALPAELNGFPGPRHVLELADPLGLTPEQEERTRVVFDAMRARALELGRAIVDAEKALDAAFAEGQPAASLEARVMDVARLRGELRWVHLRAHFEVADILTRHQRHQYHGLRGYTGS